MRMRTRPSLLAGAVVAFAAATVLALAQPEKKPANPPAQPEKKPETPPPPAQPPEDEMVADAPGAAHEKLMKLAGAYTTASKISMPGAEPVESRGECTFRSAMGGRFLMQEEKGEEFGQPFESFKMYGYNAQRKKYEGMWSYTGSTAMMTMTGESSDGGKTIAFDAQVDIGQADPMKFDITFKEISEESFSITLVARAPDGSDSGPTLVATYTRKKE
jgi:hypothetical protein